MRHICFALVLAALPVGVAHATPFEPATIPQQAEAAGHLDMDAVRSTQLFTALGGQAALDAAIEEAPADLRPLVGPLAKSLRAISFWHGNDHGAVYIMTRDARAVSTLLAKAPQLKRGAPVDGIVTYTAADKSKDHGYIAAHNDTVVLSDSYDVLAQSLRVLAGKAPNLVGSRALASVARNGVFVFVTIGDGLLGDVSKSSPSKIMQLGAKSLVVDASESAGVVTANARAELANADALNKAKSILEGMRALASMSNEPGAKQLLNGITLSTNGLTLAVTARWPVADLKVLFDKHHPHK